MAPGLIGSAGGEKSMANWDEDSLTMAVEAARDCIAGFDKTQIDATYLASLNLPFQDRQNAGILSAAINLKDEIESADFTGSMRAGLSAVVAGINAVKSGEYRNALVAAGDRRITKMAYSHELWAGDGAASLLIGTENVIAEFKGAYSITDDFIDHFRGQNEKFDYNWEERWIKDEGYLKLVPKAVQGLLKKTGVAGKDVARFIMPCVFPRVPAQIAAGFEIPAENIAKSMHKVCGDTGSAHPIVMLAHALETASPGDKILVACMGQGAVAMLFEITDNIKNLSPRNGVSGCLADKKDELNYIKFLSHRGMLQQDWMMRAEGNYKTALTTLYRSKKMILGMVGGKCTKCGTAQYPKAEMCINPECGAIGTQEDCEFADQPGTIKTYTADLLTYTLDPPAHYGMVTFENEGRGMFDFTDYEAGKIKVGLPVKMVFRIRNFDKPRGFIQYYWKAKPVISGEEV
jgi:3-hydroxy-3-methylglutaryl CoA synthase